MPAFTRTALLCLLLGGAGCVDRVPIQGASCPCPAGYCCGPAHTCVPDDGKHCTTAPAPVADGGHDATSDAGAPADAPDAATPADTGAVTDAPVLEDGALVLTDAAYQHVTTKVPYWPAAIPTKAQPRESAALAPVCTSGGWCWSNPLPMGGQLDVAAVSPTDVWVVGAAGAARRFDGTTWHDLPLPTSLDVEAVWGAASDAVWASTNDEIFRWDGTKWSAASDGLGGGSRLTGRARDDVWLAGTFDTRDALHFDGKRWTSAVLKRMSDVFQGSDGTLYGAVIDSSEPVDTLVEAVAGPGEPRSTFFSDGFRQPNGVWAAGTDDVWTAAQDAVRRFDGREWRTALDLVGAGSPTLTGVRGSDPTHVWVAAWDGSVLRWNGASFERWPSGTESPQRLSACAIDDVWVAGPNGGLARFDGQAWQRQGSGPQVFQVLDFAEVGDEIWAIGDFKLLRLRMSDAWEVAPMPIPEADYRGLWGSAADDVWVSGFGKTAAILAHWNGSSWSHVDLPGHTAYWSLWGAGRDDVWAAGNNLRHWDGRAWHPVQVPGSSTLGWTRVTGSGKDDVWAMELLAKTGEMRAVHWDGTSWTVLTPPTDKPFTLAPLARDDVWAWVDSNVIRCTTTPCEGDADPSSCEGTQICTTDDLLMHFDGRQWTTLSSGPRVGTIFAGRGELWQLGYDAVSIWDGAGWKSKSSTPPFSCASILVTSKDVWLGCGGGILRRPR
jgi:hypothetical protein